MYDKKITEYDTARIVKETHESDEAYEHKLKDTWNKVIDNG